jgi:hypothetical protein
MNNSFHKELKLVSDHYPMHDTKISLWDLNENAGALQSFKQTIGKENTHEMMLVGLG